MSGRWFRPNFLVESFLRSIIQESRIIHRSELSGEHFHEWAMISSTFFIVEIFLRSIRQESHIIHRSELSGHLFHESAMISSKFSCRDFLEIYKTREPHHSQKWAIWRLFSWVGVDFVQFYKLENFMRSIRKESHINHRSELSGHNFHEWAMTSSKLLIVESFLRSIRQESHTIHRSELSGDHFHEWATISSKFSCREFLEIFNTREPHHSQKWAIWRPFSWVGDDFVQTF